MQGFGLVEDVWKALLNVIKHKHCCVISYCCMEVLLLIDGILPLVDVVRLGIRLTYTLLVKKRAEVVVKYLQATNLHSIT